jgi:hypothetical protein
MKFLKNLQRDYKSHHLIALLAIVVLVVGISMYSGRKGMMSEGNASRVSSSAGTPSSVSNNANSGVQPAGPAGENGNFADAQGIQSGGIGLPPSCTKQPVTDPAELLPNDTNSQWAQLNPGTSGTGPHGGNFLKAAHFTGIDTVGASLRNSNLQVRSEPPNPQTKVSPWMNTTIEPDLMRVPLEVGCGPQ